MPCYLLEVDERERQIREIVAQGRAARANPSRALWIAGLVLGALGLAAFVVILVVEPGASSSAPAPSRAGRGGFASGIAVGIAAGIAIGYAIARKRR